MFLGAQHPGILVLQSLPFLIPCQPGNERCPEDPWLCHEPLWGELPGLPGEVWVPPRGQGVRVCPPGTMAKGHTIMGSRPVSPVPEGLPWGGGLGRKALWPGSLPLQPLLGFHPAGSLAPSTHPRHPGPEPAFRWVEEGLATGTGTDSSPASFGFCGESEFVWAAPQALPGARPGGPPRQHKLPAAWNVVEWLLAGPSLARLAVVLAWFCSMGP